MRKIYILCFLSLVILQQSCSKDSFDYQQAPISEDAVDTLVFNPSHYILNADGRSALYLKLLPSYYDTEDKSYAATIPLSWFDRKDYGYFYENPDGTIVELENDYLIADPSTPSKTIKVFARVFGKETRKVDVEIRSAWGKGIQEKVIPVVFHIFQYTGTANTEFIIEPVHLNDRMNKLNNAFCRLVSSGASATDTKIRFELATHSVQGRPMAIAGMNKVKFGAKELNPADFDDFYESDGTFNWASFLKYYGVAWAPGTFLNIWILPVGKEKLPSYIPAVIAEGKTPLKGLTLTEVDESYIPEITECGIVVNYSTFLSTELNAVIGKFLGLLPTSDVAGVTDGDSDYCGDTFLYNNKNDKDNESKNGLNKPITFISDNIMDTKTQNVAVTPEQAVRMHYVLENVPARKMWKIVSGK